MDNNGRFQFSWTAIKQTGMTFDGGSYWNPVIIFPVTEKYKRTTLDLGQIIVYDKPIQQPTPEPTPYVPPTQEQPTQNNFYKDKAKQIEKQIYDKQRELTERMANLIGEIQMTSFDDVDAQKKLQLAYNTLTKANGQLLENFIQSVNNFLF
ncbi:MAG: hypothetical protein O6761_01585 [Thaumarchaeota archaeon]|nr:hypothetical protein [Nitrososphaerota archaeon]